jgi:wee1-like protein kinase
MNEVFAHSALIKHKHVVRYYNSWVENGRVYIQNEYCEGGSLAAKIQEFRMTGKRFTEAELKRILLHLAKGLDYIHSKLLVHLDVKPENIFISVDYPMRISEHSSNQSSPINDIENSNPAKVISPNTENIMNKKEATSTEEEIFSGNESTDSGHHSGTAKKCVKTDSNSSSPIDDRVSYKIGDLGHVAPIHGDSIPEEGDCRYMAPELLEHDINRELLTKADIFSLGLTLFEAASLRELPKNSLEDMEYEKLKSGQLPYLDGYSKDFNNLLKSMVNPDSFARPSATKLATMQSLRGTNSSNNKSRSQLYQELKDTKAKLRLLEQQLGTSASDTPKSSGAAPKSRILVGRGCAKSRSSNVISTTTTPSKW